MKLNNLLFTLLLVCAFGLTTYGQIAPDKYYIQFTDKNSSPYSIDQPQEFLSQRAIDRRTTQGIAIANNDLPVNPQYIQGVEDAGADILFPTKWLNGVTITTTSESVLQAIKELPYVANVRSLIGQENDEDKAFFENEDFGEKYRPEAGNQKSTASDYDYGWADTQIEQLNGTQLHDDGFRGESMVIAVLDGGFSGVVEHPVFDSLWANDQILGTKSFVNKGGSVFVESQHGMKVLSCMGANSPGAMIGTAPKASYWLLHTEDVKSENIIEEYNWVSGAEFADSAGADIINSSLSYVDFDDPQWDHVYEDFDGNTAPATKGADIAASKGILIFNSAGNSGNSEFPYNGAPADGDSVISVGAVDVDGNRASFSSIGPTSDGRIRPVIMGLGYGAAVAEGIEGISFGSGTSFSSPIIAGMSACLWQTKKEMKVMQVYQALKESGSTYSNPDNLMGYGIPNYEQARSVLTTVEYQVSEMDDLVNAFPNPFTHVLNLTFNTNLNDDVRLELINPQGAMVYTQVINNIKGTEQSTSLSNVISELPNGIYFLKIISGDRFEVERLIKQ